MAMNPIVDAADELVTTRRRQLAEVVESLQSACDLLEVVETEAARRHFDTVDAFLDGADSHIERARWEALMARAADLNLTGEDR